MSDASVDGAGAIVNAHADTHSTRRRRLAVDAAAVVDAFAKRQPRRL